MSTHYLQQQAIHTNIYIYIFQCIQRMFNVVFNNMSGHIGDGDFWTAQLILRGLGKMCRCLERINCSSRNVCLNLMSALLFVLGEAVGEGRERDGSRVSAGGPLDGPAVPRGGQGIPGAPWRSLGVPGGSDCFFL